jgi:hypothetical protein
MSYTTIRAMKYVLLLKGVNTFRYVISAFLDLHERNSVQRISTQCECGCGFLKAILYIKNVNYLLQNISVLS